ncbi:MAG: ParB/RepB/Spo0J family partition protein [Planctomycetota bacterium]|nr:ParB/RepB/Spo0J family partition protein [Planctomycetota bacterium]
MSDYQVEQIPIKKITWPAQERKYFGPEELAELAATIRTHGILEAIGVIRDKDAYLGLWGQRRWMAAELAGLDSIPAVVREKPRTDTEAMEIRLIENISRESLRPLEQAVGLDQLMKAGGLTASEVAKRVGMKPAAVTKSLALLNLPSLIREKIDAGLINAAAGYHLARVEDKQIQAELAGQVESGVLSRDGLIARVKAIKRGKCDAAPSKSRVTAMLDQRRSVTLSGEGLASVEVLIDWLEELLAKARKVRPQNLALATFIHMLRDQSKA